MRRDVTEGVDTGIRLEEEDGGGRGIDCLGFAGVFSPDLTVVLPLASDAIEDARGLIGLSGPSGLREFRDCAVEREILVRVEASDGAIEDLGGIVDVDEVVEDLAGILVTVWIQDQCDRGHQAKDRGREAFTGHYDLALRNS